MEFQLTKRYEEPKGQWSLPVPVGTTICYEEPLRHQLFPQLMAALAETGWPFQFHGYFYQLRTKSNTIEEIVPASEYYKICYMAMSQTYHGALGNLESIDRIVSSLNSSYLQRRKTVLNSTQPKLVFTTELYQLRTEFSSLLFLIRSLLDQFASLIQFLSGPKARMFKSFADLMKKAALDTPPPELDHPLCAFLISNGSWFWQMRDVRDYIAHHGFVHLHLVETTNDELHIYFEQRLDLHALSLEFMGNLKRLLVFLDVHYAKRIKAA